MIEINNLSVSYPDSTKALDNLNFTINDGETVAIIGQNGAGKSTFMLTLSAVLMPDNGAVIIDGIPLNKKNADQIRKTVGMVFQNPDDQLFMPVISEDIAFGPRNLGLSEDQVSQRVDETLSSLNIAYLKDRSPLKLSGGEKRMAAIATVLAMRPTVMLFDEPSAFLDPRSRRSLINLLKELNQTKIIATHDIAMAADLCKRVIILRKGSLFASGSPDEFLYDKALMEECGLEALRE